MAPGWSGFIMLILLAAPAAGVRHHAHQAASPSYAAVDKAEASSLPYAPPSPPEGNTTFIGGTTWCVALPGSMQADLQVALDWACGQGSADCSTLQPGRDCYHPDTLLNHASWAFNSYYQQNGNSDVACNFGGTAAITTRNPSYGSCKFPVSEPSSSPRSSLLSLMRRWEVQGLLLLLLYF